MTITHEELAERLREAREASGFTQEDVAKALGLVRPAIAQIEAGRRKVSSIELMTLSRLYGRTPQNFFDEEFEREGIACIWRAIPEAHKDPAVQNGMSRGIEIINTILDLEKNLGHVRLSSNLPTRKLASPRNKWEAIQQGQYIADQERKRLNLGIDPVDNPAAVLENQGILVLALELPNGISGFTYRSDPAIVCAANVSDALVRQRYSLAHEYCHAVCDMSEIAGIVTRAEHKKDNREVRADVFASCFLMPEDGVRGFLANRGKAQPSRIPAPQMVKEELVEYSVRRSERAREIDFIDVVILAKTFGVSREAALWRLRNLNLINAHKQENLRDREEEGFGKKIIDLFASLDLVSKKTRRTPLQYAEQRLFSLAIEAADAGLISRSKLVELLRMAGLTEEDIFELPQARRYRK